MQSNDIEAFITRWLTNEGGQERAHYELRRAPTRLEFVLQMSADWLLRKRPVKLAITHKWLNH